MFNRASVLFVSVVLAGCLGRAEEASSATTSAPLGRAPASFQILVGGVPADGLSATPAASPRTLVVFAHGHGHTTDSWVSHLEEAADHGVVAVAMNYPTTFDIDRSAAETIAAARHFQTKYPTVERTILFGISMGGAVSGTALAESRGVFDAWVAVEGIGNLVETWAAAKAVGDVAAAEIEADCGGLPLLAGGAYVRRSPALRGPAIGASGIRSAIFVHALNDGLVPYDQGRETAAALGSAGVRSDFYTVARGACSETGTTLSTTFGLFDPTCTAGHASESSSTHVVMRTALDALWRLVDGTQVPSGREILVDAPAP